MSVGITDRSRICCQSPGSKRKQRLKRIERRENWKYKWMAARAGRKGTKRAGNHFRVNCEGTARKGGGPKEGKKTIYVIVPEQVVGLNLYQVWIPLESILLQKNSIYRFPCYIQRFQFSLWTSFVQIVANKFALLSFDKMLDFFFKFYLIFQQFRILNLSSTITYLEINFRTGDAKERLFGNLETRNIDEMIQGQDRAWGDRLSFFDIISQCLVSRISRSRSCPRKRELSKFSRFTLELARCNLPEV